MNLAMRSAALGLVLSTSLWAEQQARNVVLIMADDLGWTDLACQGNPGVRTPHLDRLASQGVRFTNAYAASPVCSPVRAAILTGLAPARLRITNHIPDQKRFIPKNPRALPAPMLDHLPLEHVTIAEHLKKAGYATAFLGKWHLAGRSGKQGLGDQRFYPEAQGFDVNIGGCALGGPPTFFDPYRIHNLPPEREGEYLPDRLARESLKFIDKNAERPFFLCLWPYAVHWPMEAPADLIARYRKGPGVKDPRYAAMTEAMDRALGRIFADLEKRGLAENTLVVFTSDNGPYLGVSEPRPLRSGKGYLFEGGIRVPMIVRGPGVRRGVVSDVPVISMDVLPTVLSMTGLPPSETPLDGEDLTPVLETGSPLRRDALFWHYPNYAFHRGNRLGAAIREGSRKLILRLDDGSSSLFDLRSDPSETTDLSLRKPETARRLETRLRSWLADVGAAMPLPVEK